MEGDHHSIHVLLSKPQISHSPLSRFVASHKWVMPEIVPAFIF
jgi:hypothetical protein